MDGNLAEFGNTLHVAANNLCVGSHQPMMHYALQECKRLLHHEINYLSPMDQIEIGKRLARARLEAGFATAKDAALAMGVPVSTYIQHENGGRGFRYPSAQKYAKKFKVNAEWIMSGAGEQKAPEPTVAEIEEMLREAIDGVVTVETRIVDLPRIVAPAFHEQLERLIADRVNRQDQEFQLAAAAREERARSRAPTNKSDQEESRNP